MIEHTTMHQIEISLTFLPSGKIKSRFKSPQMEWTLKSLKIIIKYINNICTRKDFPFNLTFNFLLCVTVSKAHDVK